MKRAALVVAALLVAATGCSDDDEADGLPGAPDAGAPVDGGTLRLGLAGPIVADPASASLADPAQLLVLDLLHDGLTEVDDAGAAVPALAASWTSDAEFRTWRFKLEPSARFASGRPVTASEVVASFQRVIAGGDASLAALRLEFVVGFREYLDGAAPNVAGLRAIDQVTVEIALVTPIAVLPELLAAPSYGIVADPAASAALAGLDLSGDWVLASAEPDARGARLERREGRPGHLDGVELRSFPDPVAAYAAFEDGALDWAPIPGERFGEAVDRYGDEHFAPFHAQLFFGIRSDVPELADKVFRQAIGAAIDAEAIVRAVYPDRADPLDAVVPTNVPGAPPMTCQVCGHDPVRARSLLAEGFPDGAVPVVPIDYDASPAQEAMASIVAQQLGAVGIRTTLRPLPLADYQRLIVSGGQRLFVFGWIAGFLSPDAYLLPLFRSTSNDNLVGLRSPDVDELLDTARAHGDPAVRAERWAEVQRIALADAFVIPIAQFRTQPVVAERVQGFAHAVDGTVEWSDVWLAEGVSG